MINNFRNNIFWTVVLSVVVSALVGSVFGFYAGTLYVNPYFGGSLGSTVKKALDTKNTNPSDSTVSKGNPSSEQSIVDIVQNTSPSVVSIVAYQNVTVRQMGSSGFFEQIFGFDPFNSNPGNSNGQPQSARQQVSAGSGFIVSADGMILTNRHVVDLKDATFKVVDSKGKEYDAKVMATDPVNDIAVVKINASGLPILRLGNSDSIRIGESVIAIGNALGELSNTVSRGIISGLSRSVTAGDGMSSELLENVIQTDAAINKGNSGGPLLDLKGEVIGINTAIVQGAQNIGFAIPVNVAKRGLNSVETTGKISYPFLGVKYILIDSDFAQTNGLSVDYGAFIPVSQNQNDPSIVPGSPATKAGIKPGDIILEINGMKITKDKTLARIIQSFNVGDSVSIKILRNGENINLSLKLAER